MKIEFMKSYQEKALKYIKTFEFEISTYENMQL